MKKKNWAFWGCCVLLVLAILVVFSACLNNTQAASSSPIQLSFQGEYRIGSGEWEPITVNGHIPSTEGDVTLSGHFTYPASAGEEILQVSGDTSIALYFDHIGAEIYVNGQCVHVFDAENPAFGSDACGEHWLTFTLDCAETDTLEIVLKNPHSFGNRNAVDELLNSVYLYSSPSFERLMRMQGNAERIIGLGVFIISLLILGMSFFSATLRITEAGSLCQIGFTLLFAGGYLIFSSPNISLWSETVEWNTTALLLCMMFYGFYLMSLIVRCLSEKMQRAGKLAVAISGAVTGVLLIIVLAQGMLLYDAGAYWAAVQALAAAVLLICCILSFRGSKGYQCLRLVLCLFALAALLGDIVAAAIGPWQGAFLSKSVFALLFAVALVLVLRVTPVNLHAALRKKKLEEELQESRIAIMRSQIQPHFLYNALDSIYHLCGKDPQRAQQALGEFSDYLRMNLASLDRKTPVSFEAELKHIQTYLMLEKMSSDDELDCVFDIETVAFSLPALSVQPLVENAVKHGIGNKAGGGTVTLRTREYDDRFEVTVCDDGVGFDPKAKQDDGKLHIGIENIRQRLAAMCGGTLQITSRIGQGTTAVVTIPKGGEET